MSENPDPFARDELDPFYVRHWYGELPLARSAGLYFAAPWLLLSLAVGAGAARTSLADGGVRLASAALLLAWPALLALTVWGAVGTWRAAAAWRRRGGHAAWMLAARAGVLLAAAVTLASAALHFVPRVPGFVQLVFGFDPAGQVQATLAPDGRRLLLKGHLGIGDARRVQQLIAGAPQARLLEIDSLGGRLAEARQLAASLRGQGWHVRLRGRCENACALLFLAGQVRQLAPDGRLSFHRLAVDSFNPIYARLARNAQAETYRGAGLSENLVMKAMATPPSLQWSPDLDELDSAGVLSRPQQALDVELPPLDGLQSADAAEALRTHPTWQALDRRHPGLIADAAERMATARQAGAGTDETLVAGQRAIEALMPRLLAQAGWELREQFAALLADQLATVAGEDDCRALLDADAKVRRTLPAALARRESAWLVDAAAEAARQNPPRTPSAPELEVVQRWLGRHAPQQLATLWRPEGGDERRCDAARALLAKVRDMPPAERRLAIRFMFERP